MTFFTSVITLLLSFYADHDTTLTESLKVNWKLYQSQRVVLRSETLTAGNVLLTRKRSI